MNSLRVFSVLFALIGFMSLARSEDKTADGLTPYPLDYCATCGPGEEEELVTKSHKGREIKMCKGCIKIFNADPDGYVKKVDKVIKEAEKAKAAEKETQK